jgi:hypothetical protein
MITKPMVVGALVALAGHGVVVGLIIALAVALGGGPQADLDAGGRFAALLVGVAVFTLAQLALAVLCIAVSRRLGSGASSGVAFGWVLGLAASLLYLCGGLSS